MRSDRSAEVLRTWLQEQDSQSRENLQFVTMGGFTSYASVIDQVLPQAKKVMGAFHVVHLAADKLTGCRQRL